MRPLSQVSDASTVSAREVDRLLDDRVERRSLAPGRRTATPLVDLLSVVAADLDSPETASALERGLCTLALAQLEHFPGNLFWDLDFVAHDAAAQARRAPEPVDHLDGLFALMAELQRVYGRTTAIHFRYVHDFSYGFDWAKWVRREPAQDGSVGPFDLGFLGYMKRRADELLALIERDDRTYPRLDDEAHRNPFPFSREPEAEIELHRSLATTGDVPVPAWRGLEAGETLVWDRDYAVHRVERAKQLGLAIPS